MSFRFRALPRSAVFLAASIAAASAHAIVGGKADSLTSAYQYTGMIGSFASGYGATPISAHWLVTANHIAPSVGSTFTNADGSFNVTSVQEVLNSDLSLVQIGNGTTGVGVLHPYGYGSAPLGSLVTLVGPGQTGTTTTTGYNLNGRPGNRQIGFNTIDEIDTFSFNGGITTAYVYDLDGNGVNGIPGSNTGVADEAGIADGDSGSGWFVQIGGKPVVVAISTGVGDNSTFTGYGSTSQYDFGDIGAGTSLGAYASEIQRITGVAPVPEPGTFAALGLGAAALLRRRRA